MAGDVLSEPAPRDLPDDYCAEPYRDRESCRAEMASTPTSKSQVQAYRFVLRRMESALVRKDAVMLHDPMGSHKRATVTGVIVAIVGLLGFMIWALLSPDPTVPNSGIVISQPSGQVYVVNQNPHQLIPVFNMASAKLLVMAGATQGGNGPGGSSGAPAAAAASSQPPTVTVVKDSQLAGIPMGRLEGIPDGPQTLPAPASASTTWAVCDNIQYRTDMPVASAQQGVQTSVLAGVSNLGRALPDAFTAYVAGPDGNNYLIYARQHNVNNENDSDVRALVDTHNPAVISALGLAGVQPRQISAALLNAIPYVGEITNPMAQYAGQQATIVGLPVPPGQPFKVQRATGVYEFYIALPNGVEKVGESVAEIARYANSGGSQDIRLAFPEQVDNLPQLANSDPLGVALYPGNVTSDGQIAAGTDTTMCLRWTADYSNPSQPIARTSIFLDHQVDLPADKNSPTGMMTPVQIGTPAPNGAKIDSFLMNSPAIGDGVTVRAATNPGEFSNGPIYVVTARGVTYSIPNLQTAQGLGVASTTGPQFGIWPGPQSILGLLPASSQELSVPAVQRTFDTLQVPGNAGQYVTATSTPGS
jgi:type VII secretion protein EccB